MGKTIQVYGFSDLLNAETVRRFLEKYVEKGSVDVIEVKQHNKGRSSANVQFTTTKEAEHIISLANKKRLWYGNSYLKAWAMDSDMMMTNPKTFVHNMEGLTLHFGCQISREKFSVLWTRANVGVKFGFGRKMYFFLSYRSIDYKFELSYENTWQVELYSPNGQTVKFLLIQLLGAPRIYEKVKDSFSFLKETYDEQWFRTIDFTPSCCIGQSSGLCLELPCGVSLPDFGENFSYYKENKSQFILENGRTFSHNLDLVPIMGPPRGCESPYKILFKICSMVQQGILPGPTLDINFFRLVDPRRRNTLWIEHALEKLHSLKHCCYDPVGWLNEQYGKYLTSRELPKPPAITLDAGLVSVRRLQITPCKVFFYGPEINMSNRVLRNYPNEIENFLRVSFIDEEFDKLHSSDLFPRKASAHEKIKTGIYNRILSTLKNGIVIGNKKFDFLAFSNSQLRENSLWMFASRTGLTAADIRKWMGDFSRIKNVAKYAARLGQSFGSSRETLNVARHEIEIIPDVEVESREKKYVFSDGIGKISADFAWRVATKCGLKNYTPSAFQIRYGGYKGVVAIDPMSSMKLSLRMSMSKYESDNTTLDVLAWSKYQPCFLNRQLITLLSTLGVKDHVFEKKQKEEVDQLDAILTDPLQASKALGLMSLGECANILKEMLMCGYKPDAEPFLSMMLQTFRASKLQELRTRTRIFVPSGRSMMGCLDETKTLKYGQVFVQYFGAGHRQFYDDRPHLMFRDGGLDQRNSIVEGDVVVAKNPCLHPGDVRVLTAVNVSTLHHMVDCIVFPQKGTRPHPDECSGSDLDGDIYFVCWDPDLIPPQQLQPTDYTPAPSVVLDHDVTIEEVQAYFTNFILNDSLGIIANAHTVFADREPYKALGNPCTELAKLFSVAVDFPKTGVPAEIPSRLRVKEYPDFMEKPDKTTYESQNVIGKLFRQVKDIAQNKCSIKSFTMAVARQSYDPDMEVDGFKDYINDAFNYKSDYDYKLGNLMDYYGIKTEAEILTGGILKTSKSFDRRRDAEAVGLAVKSLRKEARTWFNKKGSGLHDDDLYAKASAWCCHQFFHMDPTSTGLLRGPCIRFAGEYWTVMVVLSNPHSMLVTLAVELSVLSGKITRTGWVRQFMCMDFLIPCLQKQLSDF
ncbi:hypothetical protein F0562_034126 [Nyssa sinensis]|uniref:RNA-dependent RNA polymerase n=1 Tax=Nyssa sinensis TaxID=561372 RepID=A0A5J5AHR9_9ASTE|nr:hypothetical protein F0562_034126 [Nyssa sinensis]